VESSKRKALARIVQDLSRGAVLEQVLPELCTAVARAVGAGAGAILFRQSLSVVASSAVGFGMPIGTDQGNLLGEKLLAEPGAAQGRPEVLVVGPGGPDGLAFLAEAGVRRLAYCPIVYAGTPLGVLVLFDLPGSSATFARGDLEFLGIVAGVLALSVESARLGQRERLTYEEIDAVQRASAGLTASLELPRVLDSILSTAKDLVPAELAHVFLYSDGRLTFGAAMGPDGRWDRPFAQPRPEGITYTVARSGRPIVVADMRSHPLYRDAPKNWGRAIVGLPLKNGARVVGVMTISRLSSEPFNEDELRILKMLAAQAAIAIENAHLYQAERRQRLRRESLEAAAAMVSGSLDLGEVLDRILTEIRTVIPYDSASVLLVRERGLEVAAGRGLPPGAAVGQVFQPTDLEREIQRTGRPLILEDAARDPRFAAWGGTDYVRGWMGIPLIVPHGLIGHLTLDSRQPGAYKPADGELALSFANQAAIAVENARLHQSLKDQLAALRESQARLLQSEKLAAIGELVAGVAHELNNPLTAIIGIAQVIQSGDVSERVRQDLDRLVQEAHRTGKIVRNLLDFARQHPPERKAVQLNDLVRKALRIFSYHVASHGITLATRLDPAMPETLADPYQLQQVVVNLVNNAIEAMVGVQGQITVSTESVPDAAPGVDARQLRIVVEDQGPGVPEKVRAHIFEPFFSTKGAARGTGLGLSVCHGIVSAHGGQIRIESAQGGVEHSSGARFVVEIPWVSPGGAEAPGGRAGEPDGGAWEAAVGSGGSSAVRVLVVEDEEPVRGLIQRVMRAEGYSVDACADGQEAIELLHRSGYDLVVCDIRMPRVSGPELYRRLAAEDPGAAGRMLFITGDTVREDTRRFLESAGAPVLLKPFDMSVLVERVAEMLGRRERS